MTQPEPLNKTRNPLWMGLFGTLTGLSAPGYNLWFLAWLALIPAFLWAYQCTDTKKRALGGFLFGFCFQALYCLWFFDLHPLTWLGFDEVSSRLVTLAGWLLIAAEGGILTGLFFAAYQEKIPVVFRLLGFPLLWVALFLLLNITPMALPWGLLEYTQSSLWPMRWLAGSISGTGIACLLVFHNLLWAEALINYRYSANHWVRLIPTGALMIPLSLGLLKFLPSDSSRTSAYPMPIAIVQANLPIELVRSGRLSIREIAPAYLQPILETRFPPGTLVLLPEEGVVPGITPLDHPEQSPLFHALKTLAREKRIYIAVGVSTLSPERTLYNSIALIPPEPPMPIAFYHKRRLVPFGEFTPYAIGPALTNLLSQFQVEYSAPYISGADGKPLRAGAVQLGGLVCFELIDPFYARTYREAGADLLINVSNLGWFHQNPLIEAQFLAIGQIRAAETGTPLAIASNTGISAILSSSGEILTKTSPSGWLKKEASSPKSQIIFYND